MKVNNDLIRKLAKEYMETLDVLPPREVCYAAGYMCALADVKRAQQTTAALATDKFVEPPDCEWPPCPNEDECGRAPRAAEVDHALIEALATRFVGQYWPDVNPGMQHAIRQGFMMGAMTVLKRDLPPNEVWLCGVCLGTHLTKEAAMQCHPTQVPLKAVIQH